MIKMFVVGMACYCSVIFVGYGDVLRLALVVNEKGEGVEEVRSADGERSVLVKKEPIVTQKDVETASLNPVYSDQIDIMLSVEGGQKVKKATQAMKHGVDKMAVIVDGKLAIAPIVQGVLNRRFVVTGVDDLDVGELDNLARRISGRPLRPKGEEVKLPEVKKVEMVPYTKEEYQEIKVEREKAGIYFLEKIPSEEELNKSLKIGMSPEEVVNIYGKPYGPPSKEPNDDVIRYYSIAPELGPINPKREFVPIGFSVTYKAGRLVSWRVMENVQWRTEKIVNPKDKEPGPRNLEAEMPELDFSSEVPDMIAYFEKVKIPNPEQDLTEQDLIDLLGIIHQLYGQYVLGDINDKASLDSNCDLLKTLAFNFPEVKKVVAENGGKRILLKDLNDSLSEYGSEEKPLPVKDTKAGDKD